LRLLILDIDTLRPDHLGCYGYHRDTSPNIDRIAAEGVRFNNYYCSDAPCLPSRAAMISGRFGIHTGAIGHGGTAADMRLQGQSRGFRDRMHHMSLWTVMRRAGMYTCSISPFAERHSAYWFLAGLNEVHNETGKAGMESAEEVTPVALDWIDRRGADDNWCLHINYWDPHTDYRAPEQFGNPFANEPLPAWLTEEVVEQHQQAVGPHGAREIAMYDNSTKDAFPRQPGEARDTEGVRRVIDGYDCGIRYMDGYIGQLLDALEAKGVLNDTAIIVTSDHGENQGELGIYAEHGTADNITCRIPMIIRWPGGKAGHVDNGLHYNLDLAPTLAAMLGVDARCEWDGQSYRPTLTDGEDTGRDVLVVSQGCHVCQRSVRFGPYIYIRTYHDGYHLFPREMLFDVEEDPHEQNNLAEARPEVCAQAARMLMDWHDDMMATQIDDYTIDPMQTVMAEGGPEHCRGQLPEYCQWLEKTDRGWAVPELKRRHPQEFALQHRNPLNGQPAALQTAPDGLQFRLTQDSDPM
jgi:arylsulfatase A-like enzyme